VYSLTCSDSSQFKPCCCRLVVMPFSWMSAWCSHLMRSSRAGQVGSGGVCQYSSWSLRSLAWFLQVHGSYLCGRKFKGVLGVGEPQF